MYFSLSPLSASRFEEEEKRGNIYKCFFSVCNTGLGGFEEWFDVTWMTFEKSSARSECLDYLSSRLTQGSALTAAAAFQKEEKVPAWKISFPFQVDERKTAEKPSKTV